jgi:hypothetical protein
MVDRINVGRMGVFMCVDVLGFEYPLYNGPPCPDLASGRH